MPNRPIDANALGQLLYLQSTLDVMPDNRGIIDSVCDGLMHVPGVSSVSYLEMSDDESDCDYVLSIPVSSRQSTYGRLVFECRDADEFSGYKLHIQNLANTIALVFDNRGYIDQINRHSEDLECKVRERTAQLSQSEQTFRSVVETARDAILGMDEQGCITLWNRAASDMFGYSADQAISRDLHELISPVRYRDAARKGMARFQQSGSGKIINKTIEQDALRRDGSEFPIELSISSMQSDQGWLAIGIVRDISERKRSAAILEMVASDVAADKIYDAICYMHEEKHPGTRVSILRLKGKQLFHVSAPSLPDEYSQAINGVEIGPCVGSCGTAAFRGKRVIVEDIATDPLWADYKAVALPHDLLACWSEPIIGSNGEIFGTFAMYFDHIARPGENELREINNASGLVAIVMDRERRGSTLRTLSEAIKQAGESVIITDTDGTILYVNPSFTRMTGYSADEVLGKNPRIIKSGNQNAVYYRELWDSISSGKVFNSSIIDRRKDGSEYPAVMSISPIMDEDGLITHYVGIQQDMTEHASLEQQLHQSQKMEALGTLVGGIAHDFNNMLAGITGNLYLAKKRAGEMPDVVQKLKNVEDISMRAADMIQQLLTFARKDRVMKKRLPLIPFIKEAVKFLRTSVPENIALSFDICSEPMQIDGDGTQIHQVLMNLLNNARDAVTGIDNPGITIRLAPFYTDAAFLKKHPYFKTGKYAHLIVEDNGCGITKGQKDCLFEPFFTTKEQGKGTGLGLAMVFGAVKNHNGFIEVESVAGEGSSFHIYLPLREMENPISEPSQLQDIAKGHGELILLVDDQRQIVETGREVLESLGYQVVTAGNGRQAVELFEARGEEIKLVILDVVMPVMGGGQAAQFIRQIEPNAKIIFSTGYDKDIQTDLESEVVLSKPFSIVKMSHLIRQQLER